MSSDQCYGGIRAVDEFPCVDEKCNPPWSVCEGNFLRATCGCVSGSAVTAVIMLAGAVVFGAGMYGLYWRDQQRVIKAKKEFEREYKLKKKNGTLSEEDKQRRIAMRRGKKYKGMEDEEEHDGIGIVAAREKRLMIRDYKAKKMEDWEKFKLEEEEKKKRAAARARGDTVLEDGTIIPKRRGSRSSNRRRGSGSRRGSSSERSGRSRSRRRGSEDDRSSRRSRRGSEDDRSSRRSRRRDSGDDGGSRRSRRRDSEDDGGSRRSRRRDSEDDGGSRRSRRRRDTDEGM